ncbi:MULTISPECIES: 16S rRNA (adenine(1518)-N(6)/adenine(1519)-N(6))-dimethyltransferase RsmA [Carboxydocella]|uniref:Ribosomal RNA small subunit methyltransferase A n=2 Tax=Carboxydocella TaxID=178898 RepID=A0A1T4QK38_9FIRM|nr:MULTISPECIES: 16S rRNA (adenine(1518)-N(6)/adenine(1519)-N(6))-dimethyltransferase RsmA [Carboxydocella]AVX19244.1 16S rRNA (adenine1518-N6/adenine1519-N6)-dimethyltransferase [Carboxydocella thermautotrophica]GAW29879.1 16S rRNA (adenine(1518)-N(6)/adenine(1519)-N(6)) -dimethyltransferase [Carboxydocella sp. ULO1]GAW32865.1 16S rRNA (adenine(1518)-N(6)/adenine(1519)-N(6)) -dimethyltransferase [Carboxydocella sp. JDF658]SKA04163.1 dimethyladenosine transferase [Carboxydocella sporoproducens 
MKIATPARTRAILNQYQLRAKKKLGQNFLISERVTSAIVRAIDLQPDDVVVEIGPGIGSLTEELLQKAGQVVAIELDRELIPVLQDLFRDYSNLKLVNQDVLKVNLDQLVQEQTGATRYKLAANLPYYITTPILMHLLENRYRISEMALMVQKEVAERICAQPGGKEYGAITVAVQYYCQARIFVQVPATSFIPTPEVESAVIHLKKHNQPPVDPGDEKIFFRVVKAAFAQRRKTLLNTLSKAGFNLTREEWLQLLESCQIEPGRRGETLSLEEFARISRELSVNPALTGA